MQQLDPQEPLDELGLLGLRLFLKVSSMHTIHIFLQIWLELVKIRCIVKDYRVIVKDLNFVHIP